MRRTLLVCAVAALGCTTNVTNVIVVPEDADTPHDTMAKDAAVDSSPPLDSWADEDSFVPDTWSPPDTAMTDTAVVDTAPPDTAPPPEFSTVFPASTDSVTVTGDYYGTRATSALKSVSRASATFYPACGSGGTCEPVLSFYIGTTLVAERKVTWSNCGLGAGLPIDATFAPVAGRLVSSKYEYDLAVGVYFGAGCKAVAPTTYANKTTVTLR